MSKCVLLFLQDKYLSHGMSREASKILPSDKMHLRKSMVRGVEDF